MPTLKGILFRSAAVSSATMPSSRGALCQPSTFGRKAARTQHPVRPGINSSPKLIVRRTLLPPHLPVAAAGGPRNLNHAHLNGIHNFMAGGDRADNDCHISGFDASGFLKSR